MRRAKFQVVYPSTLRIECKRGNAEALSAIAGDPQQQSMAVYTDGFRAYDPVNDDDTCDQ
jgi:transposase-like protein